MKNTVMKILVSGDISKSEAKRLNSIDDVRDYILVNDPEPGQGKAFRLDKDDLAEQHADGAMNTSASVDRFTNSGVDFIHVSFTCKEYYETDDDGEYIDGSDYDDFAEFSDADKATILDFIS